MQHIHYISGSLWIVSARLDSSRVWLWGRGRKCVGHCPVFPQWNKAWRCTESAVYLQSQASRSISNINVCPEDFFFSVEFSECPRNQPLFGANPAQHLSPMWLCSVFTGKHPTPLEWLFWLSRINWWDCFEVGGKSSKRLSYQWKSGANDLNIPWGVFFHIYTTTAVSQHFSNLFSSIEVISLYKSVIRTVHKSVWSFQMYSVSA